MSLITAFDTKFLTGLPAVDAGHAEPVRLRGCPACAAVLDRGDSPRKPRGELYFDVFPSPNAKPRSAPKRRA